MTELSELIEKVSAAKEGSRELDAEVCAAMRYLGAPFVIDESQALEAEDGAVCLYETGRDGDWRRVEKRHPQPVTSDLQAAVDLVSEKLPGCGWSVQDGFGNFEGKRFPPRAQIAVITASQFGNAYLTRGDADAPTPALALISALLRALQQMEGRGG